MWSLKITILALCLYATWTASVKGQEDKLKADIKASKVVTGDVLQPTPDQFVTTVRIGTPPQQFTVLVDYNSAILWVPDATCGKVDCAAYCKDPAWCGYLCPPKCCGKGATPSPTTGGCAGRKKFTSSQSSTYVKNGTKFDDEIITPAVGGFIGVDSVALGNGKTLEVQTTLGQALEARFDPSMKFDGVLGLSLARDAPKGAESPLMTAYHRGLIAQPIWTLWLTQLSNQKPGNSAGQITYGAVDTAHCDNKVDYFDVEPFQEYDFLLPLSPGMAKVTETFRGSEKIGYKGHLYTYQRSLEDGTRTYRCSKKSSLKCNARLYYNPTTEEYSVAGLHVEDPDPGAVEAEAMKSNIRKRARETHENPSVVISSALPDVEREGQAAGPSRNALAQIDRRARKDETAPVNPTTRANIELTEQYMNYVKNDGETERFLLGDSGIGDDKRILIFGRESVANHVHLFTTIFVDGTFRLAPGLFSQVLVITAKRGNFVTPAAYALLPDKSSATYLRFWKMMQEIWPDLKPMTIMVDFEAALFQSCESAFPQARVRGCFFHLCQNIRRHLVRCPAASALYKTDAAFVLKARKIPALAFLPPDKVVDGFVHLQKTSPPELIELLTYFEIYYIGNFVGRSKRRNVPVFEIELWNMYDAVLKDEDRTNNYAEAAHKRAYVILGIDHPTIWKFIDALRSLQHTLDYDYEQFVSGSAPAKKRKKYLECDARIKEVVESYETRTLDEFLDGIARNFAFA